MEHMPLYADFVTMKFNPSAADWASSRRNKAYELPRELTEHIIMLCVDNALGKKDISKHDILKRITGIAKIQGTTKQWYRYIQRSEHLQTRLGFYKISPVLEEKLNPLFFFPAKLMPHGTHHTYLNGFAFVLMHIVLDSMDEPLTGLSTPVRTALSIYLERNAPWRNLQITNRQGKILLCVRKVGIPHFYYRSCIKIVDHIVVGEGGLTANDLINKMRCLYLANSSSGAIFRDAVVTNYRRLSTGMCTRGLKLRFENSTSMNMMGLKCYPVVEAPDDKEDYEDSDEDFNEDSDEDSEG